MIGIIIAIYGAFMMVIGFMGEPSNLDESPNTATLVFLTGMMIVVLGLLNIDKLINL